MAEGTFAPADAVRPWDSLSDEEKRLFSRMAEVYAGFSEYTDAQVGRIVDCLEESGQLESTIVFYCADNGASGEGSPNGSVNEGKFFNGWPDDIEQNLAMTDQLGSPSTYNFTGEGLCVGYDGGDAVSSAYTPKFEWAGGQIHKVIFDVADDAYVDVEAHMAAAMARD
jgi:arylsulfatase A-like enzyme